MSRRWVLAAFVALLGLAAGVEGQSGRDGFVDMRREMVDRQIRDRGVSDPRVLDAMIEVPRHLFVPEAYRDRAYVDSPQPIGEQQTISQPFMVALMTEHLELAGDEKVLEIGTGSGYQAAILAKLAREVYTIEIREELGRRARELLTGMEYDNIHYRIGDGHRGWPEEAPFDAIMVTAAPEEIPQALLDQLKVDGRLVIPVGDYFQNLLVITKREDGVETEKVTPVRFVPMVTNPGP